MIEHLPTLSIVLAIGAALAYGTSDFIGGLTVRRERVWAVAATSQATAATIALPFALATLAVPTAADAGWAVLAGLGAGAGNVLIFHGLATGSIVIVAPLAAVTSTALPVAVDVVGGRQPSGLLLAGLVASCGAGWLVSGGSLGALRSVARPSVVIGLFAGAGFGTQFAALGQVPAESGFTPVALSQLVSVVAIVVAARGRGSTWLPRSRHGALGAACAGVLAGAATLLFQSSAQGGSLSLAVVVTSLYPAVTVALAAAVFRERPTPMQSVGLVLAAAAIVLIKLA